MLSCQRKAAQQIRMRFWMLNKMKIVKHFSRQNCIFISRQKLFMKHTRRDCTPYPGCNNQSNYSTRFRIDKTIFLNREPPYHKRLILWYMKKTAWFDDLLKNLINIKQKDDESHINHTEIFEPVWDIAVAHIGGPMVPLKRIMDAT